MNSVHGHEVLDMMQGNSYTEASLIAAIEQKFGKECRFHTCSAEGMDAGELVAFLKDRGKFMPAKEGFTVDITQRCDHGEQ